MRLHELHMRALGPFLNEQVIDFERLGASGLFLLEGPTGVGKSTVLDAVTFALFGSVTGSAGDAGRLRSDFADSAVTPLVRLELTVRGRRLRITRTPEYERAKRRGVGFIKERPTVHLERWHDGAWISESSRQDEVGTVVGEQLGLTREQFRQVVLLPQGEFATFLRADDDGRRAVLVKLFGTQFFERVAAALQRRAAHARAQLKASEAELRARIDAAWEASGREPDDDPDRPLLWEQQVADLESVQCMLVEQTRTAADAAADAVRAQAAAGAVAAEALDVATRVAERDSLMCDAKLLEAARDEQEQRVVRLAQARRARAVRPLLELLDVARSRASATRARLTQLGLSDENPLTQASELRTTASVADRTAAGLEHVVTIESGLDGDREALAVANRESAREEELVEQLHERLEALPAQAGGLFERIEHVRSQVAAGQRAEGELVTAERRLRAALEAADWEIRLGELRAVERAARRRHEEARDHVAVVVEQRLAGLQSELAAQLVSGDPCLVCGSREHPAPASTQRSGVSEERLREAEQERDDAWIAWEFAAGSLASAEASLAAALAVAEGVAVSASEALVVELSAAVERGTVARTTLVGLLGDERELKAMEVALQRELVEGHARLATAHTEALRRRQALDIAEAQVADGRAGHPTVAARCAALSAATEAALDGASALEQHVRAQTDLRSAKDKAEAVATEAEFADLYDARRWMLDEPEISGLETAVRSWEERSHALHARLDTDHLRAVARLTADGVRRVVEAADELSSQATSHARATGDRAARAEQSAELLSRLLVAVRQAAQDRSTLAATAFDVATVDDYVRGIAGSPRMTLSTFVLRYWFEQVVAAANVRLQAMSSGKYQLLRVEQGSRASSRVGLGLAILDRHTGRERGTETLSGGESFYTSLSLALGLADVVVAEAGGAQLDTLFIDEGFGSLDPGTLDEVMTVIDELRGHGRVVGVVSHVAELKDRIPERLSIRRVRSDGPSHVTVVA